jgi:hypothetical protein
MPLNGRISRNVEDASQNRYLKVNNHFVMGGTASYFSDARQGDQQERLAAHWQIGLRFLLAGGG